MPAGIVVERKFFQTIFANFLDQLCSGFVRSPVDKRQPVVIEPSFPLTLSQPSTGPPNRNFGLCPTEHARSNASSCCPRRPRPPLLKLTTTPTSPVLRRSARHSTLRL